MERWMKKLWGNKIAWCALLLVVSIAASYLQPLHLTEGGEVTFLSMMLLCMIGYFYGPGYGLATAFAFGAFKLLLDYAVFPINNENVNMIGEWWDYLLGYGVLGVAGLFSPIWNNKRKPDRRMEDTDMRFCFLCAVIVRYIECVWNCIYFYYRVDETLLENLIYGLVYCGGYIGVELLFSLAILSLSPVKEAVAFLKRVATQPFVERFDFF